MRLFLRRFCDTALICLVATTGCSDDGVPATGTDGLSSASGGTEADSADQGTAGTFTTTGGESDSASTTGTSTTTGPADGTSGDATSGEASTGGAQTDDSTGTTGSDTEASTGTGTTGTTGDTTGTTGDTTGTTDTTGGLQPGQCDEANPCQRGHFCDYPDNMCGQGQVGSCETQPQLCNQIYDPVCGCDGQDYSNACMAHAGGTDVAYEGQC